MRRLLAVPALLALCAGLAGGWVTRPGRPSRLLHPANIPIARAKVQVDGSIALTVRFDLLAFILDQTPTDVTDPPMNALLDGPRDELQSGLDEAKERFRRQLKLVSATSPGIIDDLKFPSAADVHDFVDHAPKPRLPVMMSAELKCHLPAGSKTISLRFADVLGTVVLTTEFPYKEPISEPVDPGSWSTALTIPTQVEVDALAVEMRKHKANPPVSDPNLQLSEPDVKKAIRVQYDLWSKAYMANDVETLLSILTPDYTLKTATGTVIKHGEYAAMLNLRKQAHTDTNQYSTEILRVTLHGDIAALFSRETSVSKQIDPKSGKTQTVNHMHDYVDVWKLTAGKWLLQSTATVKESTQIKG